LIIVLIRSGDLVGSTEFGIRFWRGKICAYRHADARAQCHTIQNHLQNQGKTMSDNAAEIARNRADP